jgi:NitT/TauT family transport system substrate-binding protein
MINTREKVTRRQSLGLLAASGFIAIGGPAAVAQTRTKLIMQVATSAPGIGSTDFYVANRAGFLGDEGLDIEIRYATSASQAAQLVASGGADFGRFAFDPALLGYDKGLRLRSFYEFYRSLIYYMAVPVDSPIKSIEDVKGKTIGVTNMGSAAVGVFRSMLRHANMPVDSTTLVPVGLADAGIAALRAGRIDGFMYWNEIYAGMLGSGEKLRFIKHPTLSHVGSNGYFASDVTLRDKKVPLTGFARAIAKACVFIRANYEAAAKIYLQVNPAAGSADDNAAVKRYTDELRFWSADWMVDEGREPYGQNDFANLKLYAEELKNDGALENIPPVEKLITNDLIAGANDFDFEKVRALARAWK